MDITNLIIEVTRKCNISCDHCLRGDAMNMNTKEEYIDSLLDQVRNIGSVCFSGGEPTLNVPIMEYFLNECKKRGVCVGSFYIATNAINVPESFVMFCLKMYSYCNEKEMCSVEVSNDYFHHVEGDADTDLLDGLSFVGRKYKDDDYNHQNGHDLLKEGRADSGTKVLIDKCKDESFFEEGEVYLNCKGQIINGCNWSYKHQSSHKLCDVKDLTVFYESLCQLEEA